MKGTKSRRGQANCEPHALIQSVRWSNLQGDEGVRLRSAEAVLPPGALYAQCRPLTHVSAARLPVSLAFARQRVPDDWASADRPGEAGGDLPSRGPDVCLRSCDSLVLGLAHGPRGALASLGPAIVPVAVARPPVVDASLTIPRASNHQAPGIHDPRIAAATATSWELAIIHDATVVALRSTR